MTMLRIPVFSWSVVATNLMVLAAFARRRFFGYKPTVLSLLLFAALSMSVPFERVVWFGRIGILVLPPLAFFVTYRICLELQGADRDVIRRGVGTGVIERHPEGYFVEVTQPLRAEAEQESLKFARYRGNPVPHLPGDLDTTKDGGRPPRRTRGRTRPGVPARTADHALGGSDEKSYREGHSHGWDIGPGRLRE